ncbi:MAG: hypothetical protein ABW133_20570 [Polyangiaceae bacterium]
MLMRTAGQWAWVGILLTACGQGGGSTGDAGDHGSIDGGGEVPRDGSSSTPDAFPPTGDAAGASAAARLAIHLRGKPNFMIGMGNDLANDHDQDGAYTLGTTLDVHYAYLVGLPGQGGWPDWNSGGTFVNILTDSAAKHGVTPAFVLYAMAAGGDGNLDVTTDDTYMKAYWSGAKLLFQRLGVYDKPSAVIIEPDFWGYAMQRSSDGKGALRVTAHAPDCANVTNDYRGMAGCLIKLARMYAPKARIGFEASQWGGSLSAIVTYFRAIGADQADFVSNDPLDRDAGCFEARTDPNCQRSSAGLYWDESNVKSPTFHEYLTWVKGITDGVKLPMVWWQVPFGVPSDTPGGSAGRYRDNRVRYMFGHIDEFIAAGGAGAFFGTGAGNQTYITTDGGQFKNAVSKYFAAPVAIP